MKKLFILIIVILFANSILFAQLNFTWVGGESGIKAWNNGANWNQGGLIPTVNDNVSITTVALNLTIQISGNESCNNLTLTNNTPFRSLNLNIVGGSLTAAGNISLTNNTGFHTTLNVGSGTQLLVGGNITTTIKASLAPDLANSTVTFNGTGSQTIFANSYNNLAITNNRGGNTITLSPGTISVTGNLISTVSGASYINTGNTVLFNGTSSQQIGPISYANLTITGDKAGGTITFSPGTLCISGIWTNTATNIGAYDLTGNTFCFNGTSSQTIPNFGYNSLEINNAAGASLSNSTPRIFNLGGDLVLTSGTLLLNAHTVNINSGGFVVTSGSIITQPSTTNTINVSTTGGNSDIPQITGFLNLNLNSANTFTQKGAIEVNTLFVANGANLVTNTFGINARGNITVNGSLSASNSLVILSGNSVQSIKAGTSLVKNVTIAKSGNAITLITDTLKVSGYLFFQSQTTLNTNGLLRLLSATDSPAGSPSGIGPLPSGVVINGNVTVERYMSGEGRIYRYLSSPIQNGTVAGWQDDFPITGLFADPSTGPGIISTNASLFYYNETVLGNQQQGYVAFPLSGTAASNLLTVGRGYTAYIRNDSSATTWELSGTINRGNINLPVTYTQSAPPSPANDGWNLVGNPYPATIDWDLLTRTNIGPVVSVRDNALQIYVTWNTTTQAGSLTNGLIGMGQAFWAQATGANPVLTVKENFKSTTSSAEFFRSDPEEMESGQSLTLTVTLSSGSLYDKTFIGLSKNASDNFDPEYDGTKINNDIFNLSSELNNGHKLSYNYFSNPTTDKEIVLSIDNAPAGSYSLSFKDVEILAGNYSVTLKDSWLDNSVDLMKTNHYNFNITNDKNSCGNKRFKIKLSPVSNNSLVSKPETGNMIHAFPNPASSLINLALDIPRDQAGKPVMAVISNITGGEILYEGPMYREDNRFNLAVDIASYARGVYIVRFIDGKDTYITKFIKQ